VHALRYSVCFIRLRQPRLTTSSAVRIAAFLFAVMICCFASRHCCWNDRTDVGIRQTYQANDCCCCIFFTVCRSFSYRSTVKFWTVLLSENL